MQGAHQLVRTWRRPSSSEVKSYLRRNPAAKKACSDDFFGGEPRERAELFPSAAVGSGCARTAPASSRARAQRIGRRLRSVGGSSRRDLAGDRQARCSREEKTEISLDRQEGLSTLGVETEIRTPSSVLSEE